MTIKKQRVAMRHIADPLLHGNRVVRNETYLHSDTMIPSRKRRRDSIDETSEESDSEYIEKPCKRSLQKHKKRVRWSSITVHEFGIGLGGSSVPSKGGPSIGLSAEPEFTWTTKVGEMAEKSEGVHRFLPEERVHLLQHAGISNAIILRYSRETDIILGSRRRTLAEDAAERKRQKMKAKMESRNLTSFISRPRMIPVNYV